MKLTKLFLMVVTLIVLTVSTCFASSGDVDWNSNYVTVTGTGIAPSNTISVAQAKALARRAAVVDAYRQAAETIGGVQVDGETTINNLMVTSDVIKSKVSATIRGAQIIDEKAVAGAYEVTMRVPLFGISNSIASVVMEKPAIREEFPAPSTTTPVITEAPVTGSPAAEPRGAAEFNIQKEGIYTGLIVDCRGLGLKPAMSPVIKNEKLESIYGYKNLDYDKVVEKGMAGYAKNMSMTTRAGSKPLIIKAQSLVGLDVNPVLSMQDADKVLLENQATHFLDNTNVVFLY